MLRNENNRLFIFFLDAPIDRINGFVDEFDENLVVENDNSVKELSNLNNYFIFKENESSNFLKEETINDDLLNQI